MGNLMKSTHFRAWEAIVPGTTILSLALALPGYKTTPTQWLCDSSTGSRAGNFTPSILLGSISLSTRYLSRKMIDKRETTFLWSFKAVLYPSWPFSQFQQQSFRCREFFISGFRKLFHKCPSMIQVSCQPTETLEEHLLNRDGTRFGKQELVKNPSKLEDSVNTNQNNKKLRPYESTEL